MGLNLDTFAADVGPEESGPVWVRGHQTRRAVPGDMRTVMAPSGIALLRADEMIVECGAGTSIDELQEALGRVGQYANLPVSASGSGTVGGALSMGHSDVRRLGRGAVRDVVLRARFVAHDGTVVTAGGPTVKNVSGFDLCRLLVGSRGTLGFFGEVLLRTRPLPEASTWWSAELEDARAVEDLLEVLYRPAAVLWNGHEVLICLEGHRTDIAAAVTEVQRSSGLALAESTPVDLRPFAHRWSVPARAAVAVVQADPSRCWAEIGVGTVHHVVAQPARRRAEAAVAIEERLLEKFDPQGRLNPGARQGATADQ